jgi:DNA-binding HxlR family transcriptional regulator
MNIPILRALSDSPLSLAELRRSLGAPPQTTMRKHLAALSKAGIVLRARSGNFPGSVCYSLEKPGRDLMGVTRVVESWLEQRPSGGIELGTVAAKSAIKALVEGWSTTVVRALSARPLTLTELDALIAGVSYPSLERRLGAMRMAEQVEAVPSRDRGTPYGVTDWLRRAVGPLVSAACWERRHVADQAPSIGRLDIESAFLLALPLLHLSADLSGVCRLAVDTFSQGERRPVGVVLGLEEGRVVFCRARLEGGVDAWASGSVPAWLRAVEERSVNQLEAGGDRLIADAIVSGLYDCLGPRAQAATVPPNAA